MKRRPLSGAIVTALAVLIVAQLLGSLVSDSAVLADGGPIDPPIGRDTIGDTTGQGTGTPDENDASSIPEELLLLYLKLVL